MLEEVTSDPAKPHNKGLWGLSRWSRRSAGKPCMDPHIPELRRRVGDEYSTGDVEKAEILKEKFNPTAVQVDLTDINVEEQHQYRQDPTQPSPEVSETEVNQIIQGLATGKAPGPDGVPNEALKLVPPEVKAGLAKAISECFRAGRIPAELKESTTCVLRKEGKKDYSLPSSYRPIALENTIAKVLEKALANRIAEEAEKKGMLPWNQMGARKKRLTLSAISLLTSCVQTAWRAKPGCVVFILSLDITGAYDYVNHERLLWILKKKGLPEWIILTVKSFLKERRTRLAFIGYESE